MSCSLRQEAGSMPCESRVSAAVKHHSPPARPAATPTTTSGSLSPLSLAHSPYSDWSACGEQSPRKILLEGPPGLPSPERARVGQLPALPGSPGSPGGQQLQREEIVEAAATLVREHLDQGAEAMVSAAWKQGQLFFNRMQQEQVTQVDTVHKQLMACAATQRQQQQEHASLKRALEALVHKLEDVLDHRDAAAPGAEARARPRVAPRAAGGAPPAATRQDTSREAAAAPLALAKALYALLASRPGHVCLLSDVGALMPAELRQRLKEQGGLRKFLNKHHAVFTVVGNPGQESVALIPQKKCTEALRTPKLLGKGALPTVQEHSGEGSADSDGASASGSSRAEVEAFGLTLRCADGGGLGLEVSAARGGEHLTVVAALPGGAVASWNKACAGGARQVCARDRIVDVNGARSSEEMLAQVRENLLLKLQVQRGAAVPHDAPEEVSRVVI